MVISAAILGLAILGGGYLLSSSVDRLGAQMGEIEQAMGKTNVAVAAAQPARPPQRQRGPDPTKVYKLNTAGSPTLGPTQAKVTLVEFSDFQCPFCARVSPTMKQINENYGSDVQIVFKHLPLSMHPKAPAAHAASVAAQQQGKFWEMHDKIFENQRQMSEEKYVEWAGELGLDVDQFKRDLASADVKRSVDRDKREANSLGVTGTPAFFINGKYLSGAKPYEEFKRLIDAELAG
jgi:protein-disulfide isomerase